jgi:hypothetical protein
MHLLTAFALLHEGMAGTIPENPEPHRKDMKAPRFPVPNPKTGFYRMPSQSSPGSSGIQTP